LSLKIKELAININPERWDFSPQYIIKENIGAI